MPLPEILMGASTGVNLLQGLFNESPEDQYRRAQEENLNRLKTLIHQNATIQRARTQRTMDKYSGLVRSRGARQAAASGVSNDSVFTSPELTNLSDSATEQINQINENEQLGLSKAMAGFETKPSYEFPKRLDYITTSLQGLGQYFSNKEMAQSQHEASAKENDLWLNAFKSNYPKPLPGGWR